MGIKQNDYLGCYVCSKSIFTNAPFPGGGRPTSLGDEVIPTEDYSSVGVCLANEKGEKVDYSTPVCKDCKDIVIDELNDLQRQVLKDKLIAEIRKHDFGPRYLSDSKSISLVSITDLTNELKENEVI